MIIIEKPQAYTENIMNFFASHSFTFPFIGLNPLENKK